MSRRRPSLFRSPPEVPKIETDYPLGSLWPFDNLLRNAASAARWETEETLALAEAVCRLRRRFAMVQDRSREIRLGFIDERNRERAADGKIASLRRQIERLTMVADKGVRAL